jgi:cell division protein FtsX
MDERLQRQLVRQLRILNVWMTFLSLMVIATLVIMGYVAFKVVTFVHDTTQKIDNVQTQVKSNFDIPLSDTERVGLVLMVYTMTLPADSTIKISEEHTEYVWVPKQEAARRLGHKYPAEFTELLKKVK